VNKTTTLYFVRHGETDYNRLRIMQGRRINSSLNATGRRQALALANRFQKLGFDAVYTSSLNRTIETAAQVLKNRANATVRQSSDLDEMCWGVYEGVPSSDRLQDMLDEMHARWDGGDFDYCVEEGESIRDVQERGLRAVERIVREHPGQTVLIVTHGRLLRVVLSSILEIGLEHMDDIDHANTGVNVVTYRQGSYASSLLNCTAHLDVVDSVLVE
jgi:probable phosphoglycerate mutase